MTLDQVFYTMESESGPLDSLSLTLPGFNLGEHIQQSKTPQAGSTDQLLTPRKAAGILSVSRSTLYALINSGELRSVKIRGARRLLASDVQGYIQSRLLHLFNQQSAISNRQSSIQEIYLILWVGG